MKMAIKINKQKSAVNWPLLNLFFFEFSRITYRRKINYVNYIKRKIRTSCKNLNFALKEFKRFFFKFPKLSTTMKTIYNFFEFYQ